MYGPLWGMIDPHHSWSGLSLASHRGGPGSRPGLASWICGGESGVGAGFLRVLRFPLPKPFILRTSPSSQSPGAVSRGLVMSWSPAQGIQPTVLDLVAEMKCFMDAAKAQKLGCSATGKKYGERYHVRLIIVLFDHDNIPKGARGSEVGWGTLLQTEFIRFDSRWDHWIFQLT
jgi:hypothetical protein